MQNKNIVELPVRLPPGFRGYLDKKDGKYFFTTWSGKISPKFSNLESFLEGARIFARGITHESNDDRANAFLNKRKRYEDLERKQFHELDNNMWSPSPLESWKFAKKNPRRKTKIAKTKIRSKARKKTTKSRSKKNPTEQWEIEELFYTIDKKVNHFLTWNLKYDPFPEEREIQSWFKKNYFLDKGQDIVKQLFDAAMAVRARSYWNASYELQREVEERYNKSRTAYFNLAKSYGVTLGQYREMFDENGRERGFPHHMVKSRR